ncbi:MAG TPA: alpha/beta hydrolase-fold protein [Candidatus Limnocylindrales bacterium]
MRRNGSFRSAALLAALLVAAGCATAATSPKPATSPASAGSVPTAPTAQTSAPGRSQAAVGSDACTTQPETTPGGGSIRNCSVPTPSLAGNLLGDPATIDAVIWLPAGYEAGSERLPVVYFLAGYTATASQVSLTLQQAIALADVSSPPFILVLVTGANAVQGGFYVNSPITGRWEDAIVDDLVPYVDRAYRTLPAPGSRGIAGHSMGGFGALHLAMRHPDVFGSVYALSPSLFDADGAEALFGAPFGGIDLMLDVEGQLAGLAPSERPARLVELAAALGPAEFILAYGLAFAGDPARPALMDYPFARSAGGVVRDDAVWKTWEGGIGDLDGKLTRYGQNLQALRAIGIDYGLADEYDWIPDASRALVAGLDAAGIGVTEATFEGDHASMLGSRMAGFMIPFFEASLDVGS